MSTEDIYESIPVVRVADAGFVVVRNGGRRSERWLFTDEEDATSWADKQRAAAGNSSSVRLVALDTERSAA